MSAASPKPTQSAPNRKPGYRPYEPQFTPTPVAEGLWVVDGPEIGYRTAGLTIPCPTRMTVARLPGGGLWLHSPIALEETLVEALGALGPIEVLVAPNTYHYTFCQSWVERFPNAALFGPPRFEAVSKGTLPPHHALTENAPEQWASDFDQIVCDGGKFVEVAFLHKPSRTLILTDLICNYEPDRITNPLVRLILRVAGVVDPKGGTPIDMRQAAVAGGKTLKPAVEQMLAWEPRRILFAHGRWYAEDAEAELRRALTWILKH